MELTTEELDDLITILQRELDVLKGFSTRKKEDALELAIKKLKVVKEEVGRLVNLP